MFRLSDDFAAQEKSGETWREQLLSCFIIPCLSFLDVLLPKVNSDLVLLDLPGEFLLGGKILLSPRGSLPSAVHGRPVNTAREVPVIILPSTLNG